MHAEGSQRKGFYKQLFELSADAHLIIENNRFVDCNEATVRMLGYEQKKDVLDTHPSELSPEFQPDGRRSDEKADEMMDIARNKGNHRFVWEHRRANGDVFPVEVLLTFLVSKKGHEQIHTVWRDITERQKRDTDLANSESRFRSYVENAPLGIIISNRNGDFLELNSAAIQMSGYAPDDLRTKHISELLSSDNMLQVHEHIKKVAHENSATEDLAYFDPLGNKRIWHVNSVKLDNDRFLSFSMDITERQRLVELQSSLKDCANDLLTILSKENMAKAASRHLRSYFKSEAIGIWYGDDEKRKDFSLYLEDTPIGASQPQEYPSEIHAYTPGFDSSVPERTQAHLINRTQEELDAAKGMATVSARERVSASIIFAPLMWEAKRIGVISVHSYALNYFKEKDLVDLTMFSTLLGSALERAFVYQQLQETLSDKEILLQELQHRTRNNMNVIISLLNMQANEPKNEQLKEEFKIIEDRIYAMSTAYNKLQDGPSLHYIDLRAYLIALAGSLYHSSGLPAERVKLRIDCEDVSVHLEQAVPIGLIFNEIMSNAVTHAFPEDRKGSISINLKRSENEKIHLHVKDDGVGMVEEQAKQVDKSMGFRIIDMLSEDQLGGKHHFKTGKGVEHFLEFEDIHSKVLDERD